MGYDTEEASSEEAMAIASKIDSMMYFERDKGNDIPNTFSAEEIEKIQDFWKQYPVYIGEIRPYFIHQAIKESQEYRREHTEKEVSPKALGKKQRRNRRKNKKAIAM